MSEDSSDLDETRAALAPTLEATAAILPWVAKPKKLRFPPELAERWQGVCARLAAIWSARHEGGLTDLRPAIFELCAIALELGDVDCLRLSEALASATDRLEALEGVQDARLIAALSAALECLDSPDGLEHEAFPERARHFASRLERGVAAQAEPLTRSPVIDRLLIEEAGECLERIHDAFAVLPPDAYGIKVAADEIVRLAEPLEMDGISALAGRLLRLLTPRGGEAVNLDDGNVRAAALATLAHLERAIDAVADN